MEALQHILRYLRGEPVLGISLAVTLVSTAVAGGILGPADYLAAIDFRTLGMLFSLMCVVAGAQSQGLLRRAALAVLARVRTQRGVAFALVFMCYFGSMLVTNDVSLLAFVPFAFVVLSMARMRERAAWVVVLQTVAANLGSALSPVGNPQNIYLQSRYAFDAAGLMLTMLPVVAVGGLTIAAAIAVLVPREPIDAVELERKPAGSPARTAVVAILFALCLASVAGAFPWQALVAVVLAAMLACLRRELAGIDWGLLATFVCFFAIVANFQAIPAVNGALTQLVGASPLAASIVASQVISNVPAAVLLSGFTENGAALLLGTNVGGLGTPIASLASLISLRIYLRWAIGGAAGYMAKFLAANFALLALCAVVAFAQLA
jgi:di/tricarboxylate transporter